MTAIYEQLVMDYTAVSYEAWINLMVSENGIIRCFRDSPIFPR
jgi:hypothetical protein